MSNVLLLEQDLLLEHFNQQLPKVISSYESFSALDLTQVKRIDSAGVAYLVQIKMHFPNLSLLNASPKLRVLAELYGVENLFDK